MNDTDNKISRTELVRLTANITAAYLSKNQTPANSVPEVISTIYSSLASTDKGPVETVLQSVKPSVPVKKSVMPDYIICLEDGKKLKMLKRHLRTTYNMTPDDYRAKWGLPSDYPMVAPNYAIQRSDFAKRIGLGRKVEGEVKPAPRTRTTKR